MFNRGRVVNLMVALSLPILLIGLGQGSAQAQTKLIKPTNGGTLRITKSGSYFLGANYTTLLGASPVITVAVNNVTINLNGFSIISNATAGSTAAIGINVSSSSISGLTVVNGGIIGIRGTALSLGSNGIASGLQLIGNNVDGVQCASSCLVTNNVIANNGGTGLNFSDTTTGYENNILNGNGTNVTGGRSLGHNLCSGTLC